MARTQDVKRGYGRYKNKQHASIGSNNPNWRGGSSTNFYRYRLRAIAKYPLRNKCRVALERAVRAGILKRGCCEFCGKTKSEAHHEDYSQPLQVRWVCRRHHIMLDRWRRERER